VIELGANDGLRGIDPGALKDNLQTLIDRARDADSEIHILLIGMRAPPNLGERYAEAFNAVFESLAADNDTALVPFLLEGVAGIPELNQPDGIHPTGQGHRIMADNVWAVLGPLLKEMSS